MALALGTEVRSGAYQSVDSGGTALVNSELEGPLVGQGSRIHLITIQGAM